MRTVLTVAALAAALSAQTVALTWTASPSAVAGAGVTYTVLRAPGACTATPAPAFAPLGAATGLTADAYTDAAVAPGGVYSYEVVAVAPGGAQSAPTNCVTATITGTVQPPANLVLQILAAILRFFGRVIRWV